MPKPGQKVRGSQTGRPIMALLDILGRRWVLRIIWELLETGPNSFRTLQKNCGNISPTILNKRIYELRQTGIVELIDGKGYSLTKDGVELCESFSPLNSWAKRWERRMTKVGKQTTIK